MKRGIIVLRSEIHYDALSLISMHTNCVELGHLVPLDCCCVLARTIEAPQIDASFQATVQKSLHVS